MPALSKRMRWGVGVAVAVVSLALLLSAVAAQEVPEGAPERCVEDGSVYSIEADGITRGTVSQKSGAGCAAGSMQTLKIVAEPEAPALVAPLMGWTYLFSSENEQDTAMQRSFTVSAMCGSAVMCQATISFNVAAAEKPESTVPSSAAPAPSVSSASSASSAKSSSSSAVELPAPTCSAERHQVTYRPGVVYADDFPLDNRVDGCVYTAEIIAEPTVGSVAVVMPRSPMHYVYSAPPDSRNTNTSMRYRVQCNNNGVLSSVCEGTIDIRVYEEAGACANGAQSFSVQPGAQLNATLQLGTSCADPTAEFVVKVLRRTGGGTLTCRSENGLDFTFDAPETEDLATATVRAYCDGEPLCETKVSIATTYQATSSTAPPATITTTMAPSSQKPSCGRNFTYQVPTGEAMRGTVFYPTDAGCAVTTYSIARNASSPVGKIDMNIVGDFYYRAPAAQGVDVINVDVHCVTEFICRAQMYFTAYEEMQNETTSQLPTSTVSPIPACASYLYEYHTAPGVPLSSSLNGVPGQAACAYGRYFTLSTPPQVGSLTFMMSGDFLYTPSRQEGTDEFTFVQFCLGEPYCRGTAYFRIAREWTLSTSTVTPESTPRPPVNITNPQITCRGTCVDKTWKTSPMAPTWDITTGMGNVRQDGHPIDGIEVNWGSNALIFTVYSLIGNMGVRFPTFEPILSYPGTYFEPSDFKNRVAATSPGFDMSCLAHQGRIGMGEEVWKLPVLGSSNSHGTVGAYYAYGQSWYQKFGGKHQQCDTFADPCQYAPLLTPANSSADKGIWTIDINDCDATWTGVFPYASLETLRRADGVPVWDFIADRSLRGTLISEVVRPSNWINPGRFQALYTEHDIVVNLEQFVVVRKVASADVSPISVDAEFYTYVDENGDEAFGINMLVYPYVTSNMTSSYAEDRHVKGFKWIKQSWSAPDVDQCPTCTGNKLTCSAEGQYTSGTFMTEFPTGDCPAGLARVELSKGPQMTEADCEPNPMFVYNRSGFSASRNCRTTYQNVTFRGVARGSRGLTVAQKRAFNFEGNITLELLMDDDTRKQLDLTLSMYVARLSQDAKTATGGLAVCRSGSYWPVLDPLGVSVPDAPFEFAVADAEPLCVDDLSTSYGPSDWALFTVNLPGVAPSQVTVRDVYVRYNNTRVYLLYRNPTTGAAAIPPAETGDWWQYTQPFLAFRDLSSRAYNNTISVSPAMSSSHINDNAAYAFIFIPGAIGTATNVEVVVNAVIETVNGTSVSTFRRMLHVDPLLTQLSRQGPPRAPHKESKDNSKSDLYAIGATAGVAVAVVVVAIFYMVADNNRPLPKWVPRGKLVKDTVLSVLPAGMRKKKSKKEKRVTHRDMYDAMNSGRY